MGTHTITAHYSGNATYDASTSPPLQQLVGYGINIVKQPANPAKAGSTVHFELQLVDATGRNLSPSDKVVQITGLAPSPTPGTAPAGTFTYTGWDYKLDIKTQNYPATTYTLSFAVLGDPVSHSLTFTLH